MKKFLLACLAAAFAFAIPAVVRAADTSHTFETKDAPISAPAPVPASSPPTTIQYALPYPGILTDSPLYFLKRIRDNVMITLITDPAKKVQFYLLQSDKFLAMALSFDAKNDTEHAIGAAQLSQLNMSQMVSQLSQLKAQGSTLSPEIVAKAKTSVAKHAEVIGALEDKASADQKQVIGQILDAFKHFSTDLGKLGG